VISKPKLGNRSEKPNLEGRRSQELIACRLDRCHPAAHIHAPLLHAHFLVNFALAFLEPHFETALHDTVVVEPVCFIYASLMPMETTVPA